MTVFDFLLGHADGVLHGQGGLAASRRLLVVAVLTPLWASYLVKAYAWLVDVLPDGRHRLGAKPFGFAARGSA